jgi:hypothetical protein
MQKWAFKSLALFFIFICLNLVVLWPCSWHGDWIGGAGWWCLGSPRGMSVCGIRSSHGWIFIEGPCASSSHANRSDWESPFVGIEIHDYHHVSPSFWEIRFRYRTLVIVTAFLPIAGFAWIYLSKYSHRRREQNQGLCLTCGYDLRAHVPGQRCPECGTPIPPSFIPKTKMDDEHIGHG